MTSSVWDFLIIFFILFCILAIIVVALVMRAKPIVDQQEENEPLIDNNHGKVIQQYPLNDLYSKYNISPDKTVSL